MRWFAGSVVAGAAVAAMLVAQPWAGSPAAPRPLLPDLDQAAPQALSLRREGRGTLLVFASAVDNVGAGPLVIEARRPDRSVARMPTRQVIVRSDGSRVYRRLGPLVWYERAATHAHWHLHRFARYELRTADAARRLLRATKMGFCLGDRYDANRRVRLPREPAGAVWTHECGRGAPGLLRMTEGISVGFGDDYAPYLEGQYVDVTRLPAGRYLLVHVANPGRSLRESSYENNASSVLVALRRPAGRAPRVELLRRCPDADHCPPR
jgi:hypothetical protein